MPMPTSVAVVEPPVVTETLPFLTAMAWMPSPFFPPVTVEAVETETSLTPLNAWAAMPLPAVAVTGPMPAMVTSPPVELALMPKLVPLTAPVEKIPTFPAVCVALMPAPLVPMKFPGPVTSTLPACITVKPSLPWTEPLLATDAAARVSISMPLPPLALIALPAA